ncbi:MAG: hypothetical protein MHPSP_003003 [Paramarteilia canceri]
MATDKIEVVFETVIDDDEYKEWSKDIILDNQSISSSLDPDKDIENNIEPLYTIADTNILIGDLQFLLDLIEKYEIILIVPQIVSITFGSDSCYNINIFLVIKELQNMLRNQKSLDNQYRAAQCLNIFKEINSKKNSQFIFEEVIRQNSKFKFIKIQNNDDIILKFCSDSKYKPLLITNDKNMKNKAYMQGILCTDLEILKETLDF